MVSKPPKTIFLQDVKHKSEFRDSFLGYKERDRLLAALNSLIKMIDKEVERTYNLKKRKNLCEEERNRIESYLQQRIDTLLERKCSLMEVKQRVSGSENKVDVKKEVDLILKAAPIKNR